VEDSSSYETNPFRIDATAELNRLRPLLAEYDANEHVTDFYNPRPEYGVICAKFIGYSLLAAFPVGIVLVVFAPLFSGC
jgi:hypothetical protein